MNAARDLHNPSGPRGRNCPICFGVNALRGQPAQGLDCDLCLTRFRFISGELPTLERLYEGTTTRVVAGSAT